MIILGYPVTETVLQLTLQDGSTVEYRHPCMAGFFWDPKWSGPKNQFVQWMEKTTRVRLDLRTCVEEYIARYYIEWLATIGFDVHPDQPYEVEADKVNFLQWMSTYTVLRYLWESPHFLKAWYKKVYQKDDVDKWVMFLALHAGDTWPGHSLVLYAPHIRHVVDPVKINAELKANPNGWNRGWDREHRGSMALTWGGNDQWGGWNGSPSTEEIYQKLLTLKVNDENQKSISRENSAGGGGGLVHARL